MANVGVPGSRVSRKRAEVAPGEVGALETLAGSYTIVGSPLAEKRALARAQSYNYVTGGICGGLVLLLPHPEGWNEAALAPFMPVAVVIGILLWRFADRLPISLLSATPGIGTLMTSIVVALTDSAISPLAIFYLWVGFYAFYFLSRTVAIAQVAFIAVNYAAVWLLIGIPPEGVAHGAEGDVPYLVLALATVIMAGILLNYLRRRLGVLVGTLAEAAHSDPLTGLPNLRSFRATVEAEIERAHRAGKPVSVLIGDIDRLRSLNESIGHDGADRVVRAVGEVIKDSRRQLDTVARVGSGTYGLVLPEVGQHEALLAAEEQLASVRRGFRSNERSGVTMSFGTATYPTDAGGAADLIRAADRALDAAKVLGRDRAVVASPKLDEILGGGPRPSVEDALAHLKTLLSLAEALDLRDPRTATHAQSVGALCEQVARELGVPEPRVARVRLAGILHDIGKVGVPDEILYSPGPLDDESWEKLRRHPEIAARILGSSELSDIREWVLASQERPDGRGYPRGLSGGEIPLEARIIRVADAFESMTADRPHRPAVDDPRARQELRRGAGTAYDAEVVEALLVVLDRSGAPAESMQ